MVTVESILDIDFIKEKTELVAGKGGIQKIVSYVTIMEAPDLYEWVSGGEFVLTTWYAFSHRPDLQVAAFRKLAQSISAIGIKAGRFIDDIPQDIIDIANECNLPVFRVSRDAKFREIIQAISAELNNYQTNLLIEVDKHYQDLVKVALANGDITSMLKGIGRRGKFPCFCITHDRKIAGAFVPYGQERLDAVQITERLDRHLETQTEVLSYFRFGDMHIFPCMARRLLIGFLIIISPAELAEKLVLMSQQVAAFLTMKLMESYDTEQKVLATVLEDILYKHTFSETQVLEKFACFGVQARQNFCVILFRSLQENAEQQLHQLALSARSTLGNALLVSRPDEIVLIAGSQPKPAIGMRPVWLKKFEERLLGHSVIAGIGPVVASATGIDISYQLAKQTLKAACGYGRNGAVYYSDFLVPDLLLRGKDTVECRYLMEHIIKPLREQDERYQNNLLETLHRAMFARDLESAAAAMHIHVNTLRYRLNKVSAITGCDYFSPAGRYTLTTACLLDKFSR